MSKKISLLTVCGLLVVGAGLLFASQKVMQATNSQEFCESCHKPHTPATAEWQGTVHFANAKGVRAECADCHIPHEGFDYLKTKVMALSDVVYHFAGRLDTPEKYEQNRLRMAQHVWDDMKKNDSATCRSCHKEEAMVAAEQKPFAREMHAQMKAKGETCIDCHKGIVHFLPDMPANTQGNADLMKHGGEFAATDKTLYNLALTSAKLGDADIRLMPYTEVNNWKEMGDNITGQVQGWQQVGAESVIYMGLGQRIMVALVGDDAKDKVSVLKTVHDEVTNSDWKQVALNITMPKKALTANINALNAFGNNLNQTNCSGCHAPIGADHYTANQWIGVINSMKDRTSMSADDVRAVTIYLQRNAKDMTHPAH